MIRLHNISLVLGSITVVSGCGPTSSGEFNTGGKPTTNGSDKIELIAGVPSSAIGSISFRQRAKQYATIYRSDRITKTELSTAEQRMCRYRKFTFDRSGDGSPMEITYTGTVPPEAQKINTLRQRTFYCR